MMKAEANGHSNGSVEEQNVRKWNIMWRRASIEGYREKNDSQEVGWGHSCDIVTKHLASSCSCSEDLSEVKCKDFIEKPLVLHWEGKRVWKAPSWEDAKSLRGRKPKASRSWKGTAQKVCLQHTEADPAVVQRGKAVNRTWLLSTWCLFWSHKGCKREEVTESSWGRALCGMEAVPVIRGPERLIYKGKHKL